MRRIWWRRIEDSLMFALLCLMLALLSITLAFAFDAGASILLAGESRSPEYWVGYRAGQYDAEKKHRASEQGLKKAIQDQAMARVKDVGDCVVKLERCGCK